MSEIFEPVYCKKEVIPKTNIFPNPSFFRNYKEFHKYYIRTHEVQTLNERNSVFIYTNVNTSMGQWFLISDFEKYFTFDKNFMREEKLKRIIGE